MDTKAESSRLEVCKVERWFGPYQALRGISLEVQRGEFFSFLGPSGCGKSTLLRMIAGFLSPSSGAILLNGEDVTRTPPNRRKVNLVFQRPTLFPHLNVFDNVAFGLRLKKVPEPVIRKRVMEMLELAGLEKFSQRRSNELSGGQMQRVALMRAMVNEPELLLLDEPFSALDIKIRLQMESELRRIHREYGATIIFVTHDQREAMAMSDRIALFNQGGIEQIGTPFDLYRAPVSEYAAKFVGDANVLRLESLTGRSGKISGQSVTVGEGPDSSPKGLSLIVRPTEIRFAEPDANEPGLVGILSDISYRGTGFSCLVEVEGLKDPLKAEVAAQEGAQLSVGQRVKAIWNASDVRTISI